MNLHRAQTVLFSLPVLMAALVFGDLPARASSQYSGEGIAIADSKSEACAQALTRAQHEALESAGVRIESRMEMRDSVRDDRSSSAADLEVRAIAAGSVKVLERQERTSYEPESGAIRCRVVGRFEIDLEEERQPPAMRDPVEPARSGVDISGYWKSSWGDLVLQVEGDEIRGHYSEDDGALEARRDGDRVVGYWSETMADRRCAVARDGRFHWGRVEMHFSDERFFARWGYCDDDLERSDWTGTR